MTDEQFKTIATYLEIMSRQLDFLCQTSYLAITAGTEEAPTWDQIAEQEIYYEEQPDEN